MIVLDLNLVPEYISTGADSREWRDNFMEKSIISEKKFLEIVRKLRKQRSEISMFLLDEYKSYWEVMKNGVVR
jgi:hypothetical protein